MQSQPWAQAFTDTVGSVVELNLGLLETLAATVGGFAGVLGVLPAALLLALLSALPPAAAAYAAYCLYKRRPLGLVRSLRV